MNEITLAATIENIETVTAFMDERLEAIGCPMKANMQIDVAIDEVFTNIASYAYPDGTGQATVQFAFDESSRTVRITFLDSGIPFDPLQKPDPDITLPAEERQIGGLGIYMVKKSMDRMEYRYENGMNILSLIKKI